MKLRNSTMGQAETGGGWFGPPGTPAAFWAKLKASRNTLDDGSKLDTRNVYSTLELKGKMGC